MKFENRLPEIIAQIAPRTAAVTERAADLVVEKSKERVPVRTHALQDAIHKEQVNETDWTVKAGNNEAFYGHIVEHGSVFAAAHPFVTPAVEEVRTLVDGIGRLEFREL